MKKFIFSCVLFASQSNASSFMCDSKDYSVRKAGSGQDSYVMVDIESENVKNLILPLVGCQRTYDMYDCKYSDDLYTVEESQDDGFGKHGGFLLKGCLSHWQTWSASTRLAVSIVSHSRSHSDLKLNVSRNEVKFPRNFAECKFNIFRPGSDFGDASHGRNSLSCSFYGGKEHGVVKWSLDRAGIVGLEAKGRRPDERFDPLPFSVVDKDTSLILFDILSNINDSELLKRKTQCLKSVCVHTLRLSNSKNTFQSGGDVECTKTVFKSKNILSSSCSFHY